METVIRYTASGERLEIPAEQYTAECQASYKAALYAKYMEQRRFLPAKIAYEMACFYLRPYDKAAVMAAEAAREAGRSMPRSWTGGR